MNRRQRPRTLDGLSSIESLVLLGGVALVGALSFGPLGGAGGGLGGALHASIAGAAHGEAVNSASPRSAEHGPLPALQAGVVHAAASAGRFSAEVVAELRRAAARAHAAGHAEARVVVEGTGELAVGALPRFVDGPKDARLVIAPSFRFQADSLRRLLDEAWDHAFAHGVLTPPTGRRMFEFTGMDSGQRRASQLIYSPDGVVSVYMHGSPSSMSRHAIVLEHSAAEPTVWRQVTTEELQASTGKRRTGDMGSSSISPERVAARLRREGVAPGTPILLRACSAAGCPRTGHSIAQQVADATGSPVIAASDIHYREPVKIGDADHIRVRIEGDPGPGDWRLVLPQAWHHGLPKDGDLIVARDLRGTHELSLLPDRAFRSITMPEATTEFTGPQNHGALLIAAKKLAPGGELRLTWNRTQVRGLVQQAREKYRSRYAAAETAVTRANARAAKVDPVTTLKELKRIGYAVSVEQGENGARHAVVTAPGR